MILEALEAGAFPVQFSETLTQGWTDITSITNIDKYGTASGKDYKYVRKEIKTLVYAIAGADLSNWNNLSAPEKVMASKYFVVPKSYRDLVHTDSEQIEYGIGFNTKSIESRISRRAKAISVIYNGLAMSDADETIDDVSNTSNLLYKYINFGREGTVEGNPEALFDYLEARTGTAYATTGLKAKAFTPIGYANMEALVAGVIDILKNGNY
jgi:hypothetical protein